MNTPLIRSVLLFSLCFAFTGSSAQGLDEATAESIKTACHGNLLDRNSDPLSGLIYENSPVCEEVIQQGEDADIWPILQRHNFNLTQEDLNRMYGDNDAYSRRASNIELECTVRDPLKEQGIDGECMRRRQRLEANGTPMTQQQYEQIATYCEGEPTQSGCIEQWINEEWVRNGNRQLPSRKVDVGGLDIDSLMGGGQATTTASEPAPQAAEGSLSIDDLMGSTPSQGPQNIESEFAELGTTDQNTRIKAGETSFDNIYEGRTQINLDNHKQYLALLNEQISITCQCAIANNTCYVPANFQFEQLSSAAQQQAADFSQSKANVCNGWVSNLRGKTSNDIGAVNGYIVNAEIIQSNLDRLDTGYNALVAQLQNQEQTIKNEIARREAEQRRIADEQAAEARYNAIGAAIAIGAAGVAASSLPTEQGMELFTNITRDVLSESGSASNTISMMQNYGYGSIQLEQPDFNMTNNAMDNVNTFPQEPVQTASISQSSTINQNTQSLTNSQLCNASGQSADPSQVIFWNGSSLECANGSAPYLNIGSRWGHVTCNSPQPVRNDVRMCNRQELRESYTANCNYLPDNENTMPNKRTCLSVIELNF